MSNFKNEPYLRILTPRTKDGVNPIYDREGQPSYKESHLPLSALRAVELENISRAEHLKHRIEKVGLPEEVAQAAPREFKSQRVPRTNPKPSVK